MRKILVCQHVAYELLGTLNPLFKKSGFRIKYVNFDREPHAKPCLENYYGLIILGGPMNVDQIDKHPHLKTEVELIKEAIDKDIPILGICLGAQLIAKALGANVQANDEKEIGWYKVSLTDDGKQDPIFQHFKNTENIFQWHGDVFDLPKDAVHLASSEICANQAFRYKEKVYAFQFHLEVDEPMIERWLDVPRHKEEIAKLGGKIDPEVIRKETKTNVQHSIQLSHKTFFEFIKLFGVKKMSRRLPSK